MSEHAHEPGLPLEQFITALTSQLDRAQNAMAIKARLGYPLTFAVKELTLDLRTHIDMVGSVVQIRPAAPGDGEASVIHLALTTITRPMMEENTMQLAAQPGEPTLQEALGDGLTDEEKRRLEWAGVQTVSQLVELEKHTDPEMVSKIANVPALRLRAALERASQPSVSHVSPIASPRPSFDSPLAPAFGPGGASPNDAPAQRLRILGRNLLRGGSQPQVSLAGRPLKVLAASANELVVQAPKGAAVAGTLSVETQPGFAYSMELDEALASSVLGPSTGSTEANRSMDSAGPAPSASSSTGRASADGVGSTEVHGSTDVLGSVDVRELTDGAGATNGVGSTNGAGSTDSGVRTDSHRGTEGAGCDGGVGGSASTDMPPPDPADAGRTRRRGAGEAKRGATGDVWALAPEGYHDMPPPAGGAKGAP